jgi:gp32 DNA binding protein like
MAKKLDITKLAARLNELNTNTGGSGSNLGFLDIKDGRNVVRVLPPRDDMESFAEEVWVHYGVGKTETNKKGTMVVCPKTHGEDKPCPVCEASSELKKLSKKKDDAYDKQAKSLYRKKRVYYNAINRDEDLSVYEQRDEDGKPVWYNTESNEQESPVKVLGTGIGIYKDILKLIVDPEYGDVTDADEGLDLIITKSGSGQFNTEYDVKTVRKETPIGFAEWESALNDLKPLKKAKTYDELVAILQGEEPPTSNSDSSDGADTPPAKDADEPATNSDNADDDDALQEEIRAAMERRKNKSN